MGYPQSAGDFFCQMLDKNESEINSFSCKNYYYHYASSTKAKPEFVLAVPFSFLQREDSPAGEDELAVRLFSKRPIITSIKFIEMKRIIDADCFAQMIRRNCGGDYFGVKYLSAISFIFCMVKGLVIKSETNSDFCAFATSVGWSEVVSIIITAWLCSSLSNSPYA